MNAKTYLVCVRRALRVRKSPSFDAEIVCLLPNGTTVDVTATRGNWGHFADGWVCMDYLQATNTEEESSVD